MDYEALPPVDAVGDHAGRGRARLLAAIGGAKARKAAAAKPKAEKYEPPDGPLRVDDLARALRTAVGERAATLTHLPLSWNGAVWPFRHPLDYIGSEGGGGRRRAETVGAALALKGSGRLPIGSAATATSAWE